MRWLLASLIFAVLAGTVQAQSITVFAAASLKNAFDDIALEYTEQTGVDVVVSYAGTSALARQIEHGAPADVFAAANVDWVDYLTERGLLDTESTQPFAGNALVLIAPVSTLLDAPADLTSPADLEALLGEDGRLAVALVDAVPAGIYARQAMESLGLWEVLKDRLAQSDNVRSALLLVARGEAPLGIVYASDAQADPRVHIVGRFPLDSHDSIIYSASRNPQQGISDADRFLRFLEGMTAQAILARHGFLQVGQDG